MFCRKCNKNIKYSLKIYYNHVIKEYIWNNFARTIDLLRVYYELGLVSTLRAYR